MNGLNIGLLRWCGSKYVQIYLIMRTIEKKYWLCTRPCNCRREG